MSFCCRLRREKSCFDIMDDVIWYCDCFLCAGPVSSSKGIKVKGIHNFILSGTVGISKKKLFRNRVK